MAADEVEGYPSRADRVVAEFGDGHDVAGIAARHGLTVEQVYAVVERTVGPVGHPPPGQPGGFPAPGQAGGYPAPGQAGSYPAAGHAGGFPAPGPGHAPPPPGYQPGYGPPPPAYQPGHAPPPPPGPYPPQPGHPVPVPGHPPAHGFPDEDAVVADYAEGHDVRAIAQRHGISVEWVYAVVQRVTGAEPPPE